MKKQYITPNTVSVNIQTKAHMLFGSNTGEGTMNGGGNKGNYSGRDQLSRDSQVWDDED